MDIKESQQQQQRAIYSVSIFQILCVFEITQLANVLYQEICVKTVLFLEWKYLSFLLFSWNLIIIRIFNVEKIKIEMHINNIYKIIF